MKRIKIFIMKQIITETLEDQMEFYQKLIQKLFILILIQVEPGSG